MPIETKIFAEPYLYSYRFQYFIIIVLKIMEAADYCSSVNLQWLHVQYIYYMHQIQQLNLHNQQLWECTFSDQFQKSEKMQSIQSNLSAFSEFQQQNKERQTKDNPPTSSSIKSIENGSNIMDDKIINIFDQRNQESLISQYEAKIKFQKDKRRVQKQGRNKYSNILRTFFKFVHERAKVRPIVQKIISQLKLNITQQDFFSWFSSCSPDYRNYIRPKIAKTMFSSRTTPAQYTKIMRRLFYFFIQNRYPLYLFNSAKMNQKSWSLHLKGSKEILNIMLCQ